MIVEKELRINNSVGMHLRAASMIVSILREFECEVEISFNNRTANAKSIMSLTQLLAPQGSLLHMRAAGPDADRAAQALEKLFWDKFGEE